MPMYDFLCAACGEKFEDITAADAPAPACPKCGSTATSRGISAPSPLKKGGFPYKVGPVHPLAAKMAQGAAAEACGSGCGGGSPCGGSCAGGSCGV